MTSKRRELLRLDEAARTRVLRTMSDDEILDVIDACDDDADWKFIGELFDFMNERDEGGGG